MGRIKKDYTSAVLGLSLTGLGVIRSLGREGIDIFGFDYLKEKQDGFYSKYVKSILCPHPIYRPRELSDFLINWSKGKEKKPVLFPTSDEFVKFISDNRGLLEGYFLFNISSTRVIEGILDKKTQYEMAIESGMDTPKTFYPVSLDEVYMIKKQVTYPLIVKGRYSFRWREAFGGVFKGFEVNDGESMLEKCGEVFEKNIPIVIQEIIPGPSTRHFKFCSYIGVEGRMPAKFTLRKIRQYPPKFGTGSSVESVENKELEELGMRLFKHIDYKGVGSAEFKLDARDGKLKFIELNPRFWLQNEQATFCGTNFAIIQYLDLTGQAVCAPNRFRVGVKWIDPFQDFKSFRSQSRNPLSCIAWFVFLLRCRVFSIFWWRDPKPFLKWISAWVIEKIKA